MIFLRAEHTPACIATDGTGEGVSQHHSVPKYSLLLKIRPFKILQSGQKAILHPQLTFFKTLPIHVPG